MKSIILKTVVLLMSAVLPLTLQAVNTITYTATYDVSKMSIGTDTLGGVTYTTVTYDGMFNGGNPGFPSLPIDYISFSVPYNATNFSVSATLSNNVFSNISNTLVYPSQTYRIIDGVVTHNIVLPDSAVYNSNTYYPTKNAWVVDEGFLAGENHIVTVAVMPISYLHSDVGFIKTNRLKNTQTITLALNYDLIESYTSTPLISSDSIVRNNGYNLTEDIVINPSSVISNAASNFINNPLLNPAQGADTATYNYLIISSSELKHSLRRIASLKRQKGYSVKIVTIDDVLNDPNAQCGDVVTNIEPYFFIDTTFTDPAGRLRQYLRNSYMNNGTQYVLFVGDSIPYRCLDYVTSENDTIHNIPSDFYYSELNTNWYAGGDGYQIIDRHSELEVGRIMAESEKQVANFTDKLMRYELHAPETPCDYRQKILFTPSFHGLATESTKNLYKGTFIDSCEIVESEDATHPTGAYVVDKINEWHPGFVSFMNDATPYYIMTSGYSCWGVVDSINCLWALDSIQISNYNVCSGSLINSGLNNLANKQYPFIGYSIGSSTMPFDRQFDNQTIGSTFGESFTLGEGYGGPVFIGYTRNVDLFNALNIENSFARDFCNCYSHIGAAFNESKTNRCSDIYTSLCNNLYGDPELKKWYPSTGWGAETPPTITRTDNSIKVSSASGYRYIVCCDNEGLISTHNLSNQGPTTINNISPNVSIMCMNDDCGGRHPYLFPLQLQNTEICNSQYVIANGIVAGKAVDMDRSPGYVVIKSGVEYEIESSEKVILEDGFKVEKGAVFAVYPPSF